jgi:nucleoid-associated protein YgaU
VADTLSGGQKLEKGGSLTSRNGAYTLTLQDDGNLVLAARGHAVWASGTDGQDVERLEVQTDGNVVLYTPDKPIWHTDTKGVKDVKLVLQDDRNVVLYASDGPAWSSKTETSEPPPPEVKKLAPPEVRTVAISEEMAGKADVAGVRMRANDLLRVLLPESPSTGYVWTIKTLPPGLVQIPANRLQRGVEDAPLSYGATIEKEFDFAAVADDSTLGTSTDHTLIFELKRRWQTTKPPRAIQAIDVTVATPYDLVPPFAEEAPAPAPVDEYAPRLPPPPPAPRTYTVVSGDTLWAISERFYGDASKYQVIADASGISNPDLIHPGQVLMIPREQS